MAEDVAQPWLALHCQTLPGASQGLVVRGGPGLGVPSIIARWPKTETEAPDLLGVARAALIEGCAVVRATEPPAGSNRCWSEIAVPFGPGSRFGGAAAVRIKHSAKSAVRARKRAVDQLQSGATWLEELIRGASTKDRLVSALEVVATALEQEVSNDTIGFNNISNF